MLLWRIVFKVLRGIEGQRWKITIDQTFTDLGNVISCKGQSL